MNLDKLIREVSTHKARTGVAPTSVRMRSDLLDEYRVECTLARQLLMQSPSDTHWKAYFIRGVPIEFVDQSEPWIIL